MDALRVGKEGERLVHHGAGTLGVAGVERGEREEVVEVGGAGALLVDRGVEEALHLGPAAGASEAGGAVEARRRLVRVTLPDPGERAPGLVLQGRARRLQRGDEADALVRGRPRALLVLADQGRQIGARLLAELPG
jgi:hypothetical protein